jgi:hypothetical protein
VPDVLTISHFILQNLHKNRRVLTHLLDAAARFVVLWTERVQPVFSEVQCAFIPFMFQFYRCVPGARVLVLSTTKCYPMGPVYFDIRLSCVINHGATFLRQVSDVTHHLSLVNRPTSVQWSVTGEASWANSPPSPRRRAGIHWGGSGSFPSKCAEFSHHMLFFWGIIVCRNWAVQPVWASNAVRKISNY